MDFIRSIVNNEELTLNEDYDQLLSEIIEEEQIDEKTALDRVSDRVKERNIALYRPIVGTENLMMAKKFLELIKDNKSIPSSIANGYLPAIEMLDEIIQAGPAFVQTFQALHRRAKKR